MGIFSSDKKEEQPAQQPTFSPTALIAGATKAMVTGDWSNVLDGIKPFLAPSIGGSLKEYDKEGATNATYVITKKIDENGNMDVFLSVVERPETLHYVSDKNGNPVVMEIGDLMDIILKK